MYRKYKSFNYGRFKQELQNGDLCGLEYLRDTIINDMKDYIKKEYTFGLDYFTEEEYITSLFNATMSLNYCNNIYETNIINVGNNFNYDLYFDTKDLLFKELGFDSEDLYV